MNSTSSRREPGSPAMLDRPRTDPPRDQRRVPLPVVLAVIALVVFLLIAGARALSASSVPDVNGAATVTAAAASSLDAPAARRAQ